jgi:hypothetical protein
MRLTPAHIAMHTLVGEFLPPVMREGWSVAQRIRHGREWLVRITRVDFGYELQAWHDFLCATDLGGYRWSNKHLGFPRRIARALADPVWQAAVAELMLAEANTTQGTAEP